MRKFVKNHPIIASFVGFIVITGLSSMIGWAVGGPASAGRWGGWATSGYLLGLIYVAIGSFVAKRYEKKTGKSIQELAEEQEKENKLVEKAKKDSNTKDDDFDDGL